MSSSPYRIAYDDQIKQKEWKGTENSRKKNDDSTNSIWNIVY